MPIKKDHLHIQLMNQPTSLQSDSTQKLKKEYVEEKQQENNNRIDKPKTTSLQRARKHNTNT